MAEPGASVDFIVEVPSPAVEFNEVYRNFVGSAGYFVANNIYSRLVTYDTGSPAAFGDLAIHWEVSPDARELRFELNREARWHDGEPLTADDVAYTHLTALERGYHAASFLHDVRAIDVPSEHTLRYVLKAPNAGFLAQLGNLVFAHILPRHLYEGTDWATNPYNQAPIGSGPFRFVEHIPGERVVLEAWKDYWGPTPALDRIILDIEPDLDEAVRKVADGRAHYLVQDVLTFPRLHLAESAVASVWRKRGPGIAVLGYNYTRPLWRDRNARLAIASAVDRDRLQPMADPGWSEPYAHYLPRSVAWAYAADVTAPPHDRVLAEELVAATGLTDHRAGGTPLRLVYMTTFTGHAGIAQQVAEDLRRAGLAVEVAGLDSPDWARDVAGEAADFDLAISGGNMIPDPEITASRFETGGGRNHCRLSDPEADACYAAARATIDQDERGRHYRDLQRVWAHNVDWVPLFWYAAYYLRSDSFFGWPDQVGFRVPFWHWGRIRPLHR